MCKDYNNNSVLCIISECKGLNLAFVGFVKMWVLGVLPVIFNEVLDIVKSVVIESNQKDSERVTRTRNINKTSTKCNECETTVHSFTDLSKHKKLQEKARSSFKICTATFAFKAVSIGEGKGRKERS